MSEEGSFYTSGEINKRMKDTVDLAECVIEIKAQIDRFEQITGKNRIMSMVMLSCRLYFSRQ